MELRRLESGGESSCTFFSLEYSTDHGFRTYLDKFLTKAGPACDEQWVPGKETITTLETSKILSVQ